MKSLLDWFAIHVLRRRTLWVHLITVICPAFPAGPTSQFIAALVDGLFKVIEQEATHQMAKRHSEGN